jgi:hypothetical protein
MIFCRAAGYRFSHQGIKNWEHLKKNYILEFLAKESIRNKNILSLLLKNRKMHVLYRGRSQETFRA